MSTEAPAPPTPAAPTATNAAIPAAPDVAPASAGAPAPAPTAPKSADVRTFTQDEVNRLLGERAQRAADGARSQFLSTFKDFGVTSADDLAALVKGAHAAKQAEMTELQKAQERTKQLEADLARARADATASQESVRRARVFRENSVAPEYEDVLGVLLDKAKGDQADTFDERTWLESLKTRRPLLFTPSQPAAPPPPAAAVPVPVGATTGVIFPTPPAAPTPNAPSVFDAKQASLADLRVWEQALGIAVPSGGRG